jgi:NAD(P)H-dependent FMN reductase
VSVYPGLGQLPLFNPELDASGIPAIVDLQRAVDGADALLLASPEYAHGISGSIKNALDWLVSHEGFYGKSVAVVNTSPRARHACEALLEVLRTMSARIIAGAATSVPLLGHCTSEAAILADSAVAATVRDILGLMVNHLADDRNRELSFRLTAP